MREYRNSSVFSWLIWREKAKHSLYLDPISLGNLDVPLSQEVMASARITSMRAVQPEEPYLLGSCCNGDLPVCEIVRQLHTPEERVDLLVLMDAIPPRADSLYSYQALCKNNGNQPDKAIGHVSEDGICLSLSA